MPMVDLMDKIRKDVLETGVSFISVFRDSNSPGFMYTIGLFERHRHPELVVVGLPRDLGHWLLDTLSARVATGDRFVAGPKYDNILEPPYRLALREVHRENMPEYVGMALRYYGNSDFTVNQVFLPDVRDLFPWEEGYKAKVPADLRLLYLPPPHVTPHRT
jgi:hypothetical protein